MATRDPNDKTKLNLSLVQQEELSSGLLDSSRNSAVNPIREFRHVCLKQDKEVTIVMREKGELDLYWNRRLVATSTDDSDVDYSYLSYHVNFSAAILKRKGSNETGNTVGEHYVTLSFE